MGPKDADGIANSVDPDQTAPLVSSGSALFAKTCPSENLGSLQYLILCSLHSSKQRVCSEISVTAYYFI